MGEIRIYPDFSDAFSALLSKNFAGWPAPGWMHGSGSFALSLVKDLLISRGREVTLGKRQTEAHGGAVAP